MKKQYKAPRSERIALNLTERIASSGKPERYWIAVGREGDETPLYDGKGDLDELIEALKKLFGNG